MADGAADAVVVAPFDEVGGDAARHDDVLDEVADLVVDERGDDDGLRLEMVQMPPQGLRLAGEVRLDAARKREAPKGSGLNNCG